MQDQEKVIEAKLTSMDAAMTIKNAEEAKKSERPKIFQKHLEFIVNSMQSLVNLRYFQRWRWQ